MEWSPAVQRFVSEAAFSDTESDLAWQIHSNMVDHTFLMNDLVNECRHIESVGSHLEEVRSLQVLIDRQLQEYAVEVMGLELGPAGK